MAAVALRQLGRTEERSRAVLVWLAICAMLPDADVVAFWFGVPYDSLFGHRGITHSIPFALGVGLLAARLLGRRDLGTAAWFALATASHPLLDALTDGGRGVALLAPFSADRYFFPWRPIAVSPIGIRFFSPRGLRVVVSELGWIWVPAALAVAAVRRRRRG